jgi:hypothetical protein
MSTEASEAIDLENDPEIAAMIEERRDACPACPMGGACVFCLGTGRRLGPADFSVLLFPSHPW